MISSLLLILVTFSSVRPQRVNVNCSFSLFPDGYFCQLVWVTISDNPNADIVIGGNHNPGRTNADVTGVQITQSNIAFVVTQLFTTFPNLEELSINNGGLTRIQPNAFINARNLQRIHFINHPSLQSIDANAFAGLVSLNDLTLRSNGIVTVHEQAFVGLSSLLSVSLAQNRIVELPSNVFAPLNSLIVALLGRNQLKSLDGRLFANNRQLVTIEFPENRINAIGRSFLDNLPNLRLLDLRQNLCTDQQWVTGGIVTIDFIRANLDTCFNNAVEPPDNELRRFVIEVRGPFSLKFENGTNIVTV
jgi:Leucine-rich repeat (LRR) protein